MELKKRNESEKEKAKIKEGEKEKKRSAAKKREERFGKTRIILNTEKIRMQERN